MITNLACSWWLIHHGAQAKTKAKKRYLKAKKERRKKRKVLAGNTPRADSTTSRRKRDEGDESGSDEAESSGSESEGASASEQEKAASEIVPSGKRVERDGERPKKRRKVDTEEADARRASSPEEDEVAEPLAQPSIAPRTRSPTPPVALPAFPQPRRPEAPSKSVLALQGLDKALIEAEIVDPATTVPLDAANDAHDERTGLSARMRRRLQDLGISELFAGLSWSPVHYQCIPFTETYNSTNRRRAVTPLFVKINSVVPTLRSTGRPLRVCAYRKRENSGLCFTHCRGMCYLTAATTIATIKCSSA